MPSTNPARSRASGVRREHADDDDDERREENQQR
jgi:hypothetical protein